MDLDRFARRSDYEREIPMHGAVRVPAVIFADEALIRPMDQRGVWQHIGLARVPAGVGSSGRNRHEFPIAC